MNSLLFRLKNKDLFKPNGHKPILTWLGDLKHYDKTNYRKIDIILDYRHMSDEDIVTLYKMLNHSRTDHMYDGLYCVDSMMKRSDNLVELAIYDAVTVNRNVRVTMWINNTPVDIYEAIWQRVRDILFSNVPKTLRLAGDESKMLKLAEYEGDINVISTENCESKQIDVNVLENTVVTNVLMYQEITHGDMRVSDVTTKVRRYEIKDTTSWLLVIPNNAMNQATMYISRFSKSDTAWNKYIGRRP